MLSLQGLSGVIFKHVYDYWAITRVMAAILEDHFVFIQYGVNKLPRAIQIQF